MKIKLLLILLIFSFLYSLKLKAQIWVDVDGGNSIVNGTIKSMVADDSNNLYAVGDFYNATSANYVAKWNGTKWSEVVGKNGKGLMANDIVETVIVGDSGFIYVAGNFTNSNGKRYVAKYDGTSWSELGTGSNALAANNTIRCLLRGDSGYMYAAGFFSNSNGKRYVAKWDGTSWAELAGSDSLNANNYIYCITKDDSGHLYAAGAFTNAKGYRHVAKWDGTSWNEVGSGTNALTTNLLIYTIAVDSQFNIYAAGEYYLAKTNVVAKWHDTSWSEVGKLSFNLDIYSLSPYRIGELLAVGYGFIIHWDGNDWDYFGSSYLKANGPIYKVLVDKKNDVYVGGDFSNWHLGAYYIAKYDCRPPEPIDSTPASELSICSGNSSKLYAVGNGKISWYSDYSGGTLLDTGNFYQTSILTKDTFFYAQDSNDCGASLWRTQVRIKVNPLPNSSSLHYDNRCNGDNNGIAIVKASGGTGKLTYDWYPSGGSDDTASYLNGGVYICTITDSKLCSIYDTIIVFEPTAIKASIISLTNNACHGEHKGTVTISTSGGTGSHGYDWSQNGGNMATQGNLSAGTYICTITDSNLCKMRDTVTITEPAAINVKFISQQNNIKCYGDSSGSVSVSASGGTGTLQYSWSPSGGNAATANNLKAGKYICTLTDSNMCTKTISVTITEPSKIIASIISQKDITCHGGADGSASANARGGTGTLKYSWLPSGGNAATANNLMAGNYTCTITDSNNCTATQQVTIIEPSAIDTSVTQAGFTLTAVATPANYQWLNCAGNTIINGATNKNYTPTSSGSYAAIISQNTCSDTSGCHTIVIQGISGSNVLYSFEVWPNPVKDILYINHLPYTKTDIVLNDMLGKKVYNAVTNGEILYNIPVGHLSKGLYILSVGGEKVKVVIE